MVKIFLITLLFLSGCLKESSYKITDIDKIIKKAEAELVNKYGQEVLKQRPFILSETENSWIVSGSFHCPKNNRCKGGVASVQYNKVTGEIERVVHGK